MSAIVVKTEFGEHENKVLPCWGFAKEGDTWK